MKYIALLNTWFDVGTIAELIDDYRADGLDSGLFSGWRNGRADEEICGFDEFETLTHEIHPPPTTS
jgi:hypothetical protein